MYIIKRTRSTCLRNIRANGRGTCICRDELELIHKKNNTCDEIDNLNKFCEFKKFEVVPPNLDRKTCSNKLGNNPTKTTTYNITGENGMSTKRLTSV